MNRKQDWRSDSHFPPKGNANIALITAIKIVGFYGKVIPQRDQIVLDFGVSKSTATRWRCAMRMARGVT